MNAFEMERSLDRFAKARGFRVAAPRFVTENVDVTDADGERVYSESWMDWCGDCAEGVASAARKALPPERAEAVEVAFSDAAEEHSTPPQCSGCAMPLDGLLNEAGVNYELTHFLDAPLDSISADGAFAIARMVESAPENAEVLALAERAVWLADNGFEKGVAEAPNDLKGVRLGPWTPVDGGHCCTRAVEGGDPENVEDRVAFIEKTPRVLHNGAWTSGPKGSGGSGDAEAQGHYGFDSASRAWADAFLRVRGAELADEPAPAPLAAT